MPGQKRLAGALAVAATAVAISACGSSNSSDQTIDPADANELTSALSGVESAVASGNCKRAETEAVDFVAVVNQLPDTVGTTNKEALRSAGENLQKLAQDPSQCKPSPTGASGLQGDQSTSTSTTTTEAVPTTPTTTTATTTSESAPGNSGNNQGGGPPTGTPPGQGNTGGGSTGGGETGGGGSAGGGGGTGSGGTGVGGGGSD
ncbi:MAG TPA: hypothetical protein VEP94_04490 [Solirubrobacterales bacterium]|nr:hypothetical protein [Solirubrobacterales bacterium]